MLFKSWLFGVFLCFFLFGPATFTDDLFSLSWKTDSAMFFFHLQTNGWQEVSVFPGFLLKSSTEVWDLSWDAVMTHT